MKKNFVAKCASFEHRGHVIPVFEIRPGERISLGMPFDVSYRDIASRVEEVLRKSGYNAQTAIVASGEVDCLNWLCNEIEIDREHARSIVVDAGLQPERKMQTLAFTPLTILGIALAFLKKCDVLLYHSIGTDPRGTVQIDEYVARHLENRAAIKLIYPTLSYGGGIEWDIPAKERLIQIGTGEAVRASAATDEFDRFIDALRSDLER